MNTQISNTTLDANNLIMNHDAMGQMFKLAELMAGSRVTVPKHLQGNSSDCMAIAMQAAQWGLNPFAVAQKTHLVNGTLGYEAQLVNAVISSSRAVRGRFKYEYRNWQGQNGEIRCGAILAGENEITWGEWLDTKAVTTKNSPLWKTAPKQQASYLVLKYWARLYTPEVIMGVYTPDELERPAERDVTPPAQQTQHQALTNTRNNAFNDLMSDVGQARPETVQAEDVINENTGEVTHAHAQSEPDPGQAKIVEYAEIMEQKAEAGDLKGFRSSFAEGYRAIDESAKPGLKAHYDRINELYFS